MKPFILVIFAAVSIPAAVAAERWALDSAFVIEDVIAYSAFDESHSGTRISLPWDSGAYRDQVSMMRAGTTGPFELTVLSQDSADAVFYDYYQTPSSVRYGFASSNSVYTFTTLPSAAGGFPEVIPYLEGSQTRVTVRVLYRAMYWVCDSPGVSYHGQYLPGTHLAYTLPGRDLAASIDTAFVGGWPDVDWSDVDGVNVLRYEMYCGRREPSLVSSSRQSRSAFTISTTRSTATAAWGYDALGRSLRGSATGLLFVNGILLVPTRQVYRQPRK